MAILYFAATSDCPVNPTSAFNGVPTGLPTTCAGTTSLQSILGIVFGVIAAVAVLIIVIQGIKFMLSNGEPQKAADARKGIIYALVGLGVALSAEAVVRLVIGKL